MPDRLENDGVDGDPGVGGDAVVGGDADMFFSTEGDTNTSLQRRAFVAEHLDDVTREILAEDAKYFLHQALSTPCWNVLRGGAGATLTDWQRREILDFHGNAVHQLGHAHPELLAVARDQLAALPFCPRRFTNEPAVRLARRLSELAPVRRDSEPARVLLAPAGSLAMSMALKLARYATGRFKTISMWDAFHGASLDAISVGGEPEFRVGVGPLMPGAIHVPPYAPDGLGAHSAEYVQYVLEREPDISAVVAEPMRWTRVVRPPDDYWPTIRALCDRHGALLILDEVPACLGRTGYHFCSTACGAEPDIVLVGKGLGGGIYPLAAMIARGGLNVAPQASLGHFTHEKNPVACAVAHKTLEIIDRDGLLERAQRLGSQVLSDLRADLADCSAVSDVRGLGMQWVIELSPQASPRADELLYNCLRRGLSFKIGHGNTLSLSPPLTIAEESLRLAMCIVVAELERLVPR